ncbi:LacI family DNA-binding transcriptional regulator [Leadbetterella byssophila]|uniref:Transcriptional regulator, LacI family n=1 Tax=Leadbetterella byssophila (strain DSM 17132 / JCM 16389 / KACC 11308 / NBRC 106382 / 4M15) TaxID=649349 RepID=E4RVQ0_LEAB4|nr:LacI family DNA-binding transcriptional regulator [Leadbetterella byssophila]ADQ17949.1 transcriptional regulator, LacI family [Leadbetterella byssophila DSM 17132]
MAENVTIKTIASLLGISHSTVSRALQNNPRIGLRTRERVQEMAKNLKYVSNSGAQLLKNVTTHSVGIVVPNLHEEYFSMMISGIEDVLGQMGYQAIICQSRDDMQREKKAVEHFLRARVEGLLVSLSATTNQYDHFQNLGSYGIPIVFCDRTPKGFPSFRVRSVVETGMKSGLEYLFQKGIRKIALLNGPSYLLSADERLNTYLQGMLELKLETSPKYIRTTDLSKEDTSHQMRELLALENIPEAIIAFNDYVALDAIKVCREAGYNIPFLSFGNLPITNYMEHGPIASVEQFPYEIGQKAAELLRNVLNTKDLEYKEEVVHSVLKIRE